MKHNFTAQVQIPEPFLDIVDAETPVQIDISRNRGICYVNVEGRTVLRIRMKTAVRIATPWEDRFEIIDDLGNGGSTP